MMMGEGKKIFTNRSLMVFLVLTIVISAVFETVIILQGAMGLAALLMWVPALAAVISACIAQKGNDGTISFKRLLRNLGFRMVSLKWILFSCMIPLVYIGIPYVIFWRIFPGSLDMNGRSAGQMFVMAIAGILVGLITAIGEEIGWRGFFVPAVMERVGLMKALFFTSLFWGLWHLPILISGLYMPGTPVGYKVPAFLLMIIPVGMIYGLVTVKSGSVWTAALLHAAHNTFDQMIFGTVTTADNKMFFVSETGILTIVCAWILFVILYIVLNAKNKA